MKSGSTCRLTLLLCTRAECEDRLRAEFRIEMNAAVAESEQRWQGKEQELQSQISELQSQLSRQQSQVGVLPTAELSLKRNKHLFFITTFRSVAVLNV